MRPLAAPLNRPERARRTATAGAASFSYGLGPLVSILRAPETTGAPATGLLAQGLRIRPQDRSVGRVRRRTGMA